MGGGGRCVGGARGGATASAVDEKSVYPHAVDEAHVFVRVPAGARAGDEVKVEVPVTHRGKSGRREYVATLPPNTPEGAYLRVVLPFDDGEPAVVWQVQLTHTLALILTLSRTLARCHLAGAAHAHPHCSHYPKLNLSPLSSGRCLRRKAPHVPSRT